MEFCLQVLWPALDVQVASVSEQWAQFAIAGPKAREVLRILVDRKFDVADTALPYLAARSATVCNGTPARLFRLSFSGELGFEIAVPARVGSAFCRAAMQAGAPLGMTPYGLEALNVLRIEKGHITHAELNGQTTARDLGFERMMAKNKDFVGRTMAGRPALIAPERPVLVGVKALDPQQKLSAGAHFIPIGAEARIENDEGWVSSACHSPTLGHAIGLGFLKNGRRRIGEQVRAYDPLRKRDTEVEICLPTFFDPQGERLRV
jgi:sarcosine oxidase subunit alpha